MTHTVPNTFTFVDISNAELSNIYESNTVTITGMNVPAMINISGGQYAINGGMYTASGGSINSGDTVKVKVTSSAIYLTAVNAVLLVTYTCPSLVTGSGG